jgi:hypothetical protein
MFPRLSARKPTNVWPSTILIPSGRCAYAAAFLSLVPIFNLFLEADSKLGGVVERVGDNRCER